MPQPQKSRCLHQACHKPEDAGDVPPRARLGVGVGLPVPSHSEAPSSHLLQRPRSRSKEPWFPLSALPQTPGLLPPAHGCRTPSRGPTLGFLATSHFKPLTWQNSDPAELELASHSNPGTSKGPSVPPAVESPASARSPALWVTLSHTSRLTAPAPSPASAVSSQRKWKQLGLSRRHLSPALSLSLLPGRLHPAAGGSQETLHGATPPL